MFSRTRHRTKKITCCEVFFRSRIATHLAIAVPIGVWRSLYHSQTFKFDASLQIVCISSQPLLSYPVNKLTVCYLYRLIAYHFTYIPQIWRITTPFCWVIQLTSWLCTKYVIKKAWWWRPVSPICKVNQALMLFWFCLLGWNTAGHGWGISCFGGINHVLFCSGHIIIGSVNCWVILYVNTVYFLVWYKYAEYGIAINPCSTEPRYWQNHVDYILALNASLLLCKEPSAVTILFDVKYSISALNYSNFLTIILCWFYYVHIEMRNIHCQKINADNIVITRIIIHKH